MIFRVTASRLAAHPLSAQLWSFMRRLYARGVALRLPQTAGSLAYLSLFALVPVTMIALAALTALPAFGRLRERLQDFLATNLFPAAFSDTVVQYVNQFASQAGGLSALGLAVFLATAATTLFTVEQTLNAIWQVEPRRSMVQRVGLYWTMLTLAPPILGASLAMESYFWTLSLSVASELRGMQRLSAAVLPWVLTVAMLTAMYRLLPGERVRWRHAMVGALVAAAALQGWKAVLGHYAAQFTTYTVVYGAFGVLPALLSWIYVVWLTVLVGALIASESRYWARPWHGDAALTPVQRFELARRALEALARTQARDRVNMMTARQLAGLFEHHADDACATAKLLESAGYIRRLLPPTVTGVAADTWDECWVLVRDASELTLRALRDAVWRGEPVETEADATMLLRAGGAGTAVGPADSELDVPLKPAAG